MRIFAPAAASASASASGCDAELVGSEERVPVEDGINPTPATRHGKEARVLWEVLLDPAGACNPRRKQIRLCKSFLIIPVSVQISVTQFK